MKKIDTMAPVIYCAILGFSAGVFLRSFFDFGLAFILLLVLLAAALVAASFVFVEGKAALFGALALCAVAFGDARFELAAHGAGDPVLDELVGTEIAAEGVVVDEPDARLSHMFLTVELAEANGEPVESRVRVLTNRYPAYAYGDRITLRGELEAPENFETEYHRIFNYRMWLAKDGVYYQMFRPELERIGEDAGNPVKAVLFALKQKLVAHMNAAIPDPEAALAGGLIVGEKRALGGELTEAFRATGIIHIVVLSGYNVSIVANNLMHIAERVLPYLMGIVTGGSAIILFVIMTGAEAATVRAGIMAIIALVARATGRTYAMTRALFVAAFLMVLYNPHILVFDPGFQLSFVATLGLITASPHIDAWLRRVPLNWRLREIAVATLATQLLVLPLLLYQIGELSLVAVPVNLLILLVVPATMFVGFLTGLAGFVSEFLALPFGYISYALLHYQLVVVDWFSSLSFASVAVPPFAAWLMLAGYGVIAYMLYRLWRSR